MAEKVDMESLEMAVEYLYRSNQWYWGMQLKKLLKNINEMHFAPGRIDPEFIK